MKKLLWFVLVLVALGWAWIVWPTRYAYYTVDGPGDWGGVLMRRDRFTGRIESVRYGAHWWN